MIPFMALRTSKSLVKLCSLPRFLYQPCGHLTNPWEMQIVDESLCLLIQPLLQDLQLDSVCSRHQSIILLNLTLRTNRDRATRNPMETPKCQAYRSSLFLKRRMYRQTSEILVGCSVCASGGLRRYSYFNFVSL